MTKNEMTFNDYQNFTRETAIYPKESKFEYLVLGLVGEAGEIANKYKKVIRDQNSEINLDNLKDLLKESGDVLWYLARIADECGADFDTVAVNNINKLLKRKEDGTIQGSGDDR